MKINKLIVVGVSLIALSTTASADMFKESGQRSASAWVECLNDTILIEWKLDMVVTTIETKRTWMFTRNVRQKGAASDSFGNTWKFNGHFQTTEHVDLAALQYTTNFHLLSHDVMVGQPGGPGNLLFRTMWRITVDEGVPTLVLKETTVDCLP
jgi:hypothetical protein